MLDGVKEKLFGVKCERCGQRTREGEFCDHCGISLGFSRPAILEDNRWEAAPDELAVFFKIRQLKGFFSKTVRVPAGMRAWILQESKVSELPEGEYTTENFLGRLNNLFQDKHTEFLITRQAAVPVSFTFDDISSAEFLKVTVNTTLHVRVGNVSAFRNHFMLRAGVVSTTQLREILQGSVRQVIAESLGGLRIEEMLKDGHLRETINANLQSELQSRFADFGLAFDNTDTLSIRHDRYSTNLELVGSLWLERDESRVRDEHQTELSKLYDQREWAKIQADEADMRRRYRRSELKQDEAELAQVIRLREVKLYTEVLEAETVKQIAILEDREKFEVLDNEYSSRRHQRHQRERELFKENWQEEDEATQLRHARELATLRRNAELAEQKERREESRKIERLQIENTIEKQRIQSRIEQTRLVEDDELRKQQEAQNRLLAQRAAEREQEILKAQNDLKVEGFELDRMARRRTVFREQDWEDAQFKQRIVDLQNKAKADAEAAKHKGDLTDLEKVVQIHNERKAAKLAQWIQMTNHQLEIDAKLRKNKQDELDRAFVREKESLAAERAHSLVKAEKELDRIRVLGSLPLDVQIACANDPAIVDALVKMAAINKAAGGQLTTEQILAIQVNNSADAVEILKGKSVSQQAASGSVNVEVKIGPEVAELNEAKDKSTQQTFEALQQSIRILETHNEQAQRNLLDMGKHGQDKIAFSNVGIAQALGNSQAPINLNVQPSAPQASPQPQYASAVSNLVCSCGFDENSPRAKFCGNCNQPLNRR